MESFVQAHEGFQSLPPPDVVAAGTWTIVAEGRANDRTWLEIINDTEPVSRIDPDSEVRPHFKSETQEIVGLIQLVHAKEVHRFSIL
ncbi:MAG TPA: hypothetical protein VK463_14320 [Desulfomonilaceae bacterium]|nr:hypothetical protein [Desulfomonilaceae bacterium]